MNRVYMCVCICLCVCVCVQPPGLFHNVLAMLHRASCTRPGHSDGGESRNSFTQDAPHSCPHFIGSGLVLGRDGDLIGGDTLAVKGIQEVGQCRGPDPPAPLQPGSPLGSPGQETQNHSGSEMKIKTISLQRQRHSSLTTDWSC